MALIGYVEEADFVTYAAARGITLLLDTAQTLTKALDYIELQSYSGAKTDPEQALQFPRDGDTEVPDGIITAQIQVALLYDVGIDILAPIGVKVLENTVHGAVTQKFSDKGGNSTLYPQITALLAPFLTSFGGNSFKVTRA